jgi:hypothetical protein
MPEVAHLMPAAQAIIATQETSGVEELRPSRPERDQINPPHRLRPHTTTTVGAEMGATISPLATTSESPTAAMPHGLCPATPPAAEEGVSRAPARLPWDNAAPPQPQGGLSVPLSVLLG